MIKRDGHAGGGKFDGKYGDIAYEGHDKDLVFKG
jgi:hypothetical protein